jgi:hypothetical protein
MAQKKEAQGSKKGVKVQDLAPKKDAKGGRVMSASGASSQSGASLSGANSLSGASSENAAFSSRGRAAE